MADDPQQAQINISVVQTDEQTFKPPPFVEPVEDPAPGEVIVPTNTDQAVKQIFAVLTPEEVQDTTYFSPEYTDWFAGTLPPFIPTYAKVPEFQAPTNELIINIETTRVKPWEGNIFCIGVMDPNVLKPEIMNFINETEEETIDEFIEWFKTTRYTTLIGYNVAFDYRFMYVVMQKYRRSVPSWLDMELYDVMQQQEQVKHEFVYGRNPSGKLEDWATYLFGMQPYAKQEEVFKWHKDGNIDEIVNFNSDKIMKTYFLWVLNKVVGGSVSGAASTGASHQTGETTQTTANPVALEAAKLTIPVACPNCMQIQEMPRGDKSILCEVCGTPIAHPGL